MDDQVECPYCGSCNVVYDEEVDYGSDADTEEYR